MVQVVFRSFLSLVPNRWRYALRYRHYSSQGRRNDFGLGGLKSPYRFLGGLNRLFREFLLRKNDLLG